MQKDSSVQPVDAVLRAVAARKGKNVKGDQVAGMLPASTMPQWRSWKGKVWMV